MLGNFVIRLINHGYRLGEISITQKQGIIICILQDGKNKKNLHEILGASSFFECSL